MEALRNVLSKTLYSRLSTDSTYVDREASRHDCKNVDSDTKHRCKKTKSTQNNRKRHSSLFLLQLCASTGI